MEKNIVMKPMHSANEVGTRNLSIHITLACPVILLISLVGNVICRMFNFSPSLRNGSAVSLSININVWN